MSYDNRCTNSSIYANTSVHPDQLLKTTIRLKLINIRLVKFSLNRCSLAIQMIPLAGADYSIDLEFDKKRSFEMNLSLQMGHVMFASASVIYS